MARYSSFLAAGALAALSMSAMSSGSMPTVEREYQPPFKPKSKRKAALLAKSMARQSKDTNQ